MLSAATSAGRNALALGAGRRAIPSLDGLRALSITLVLLGHSALRTGFDAGPIDPGAWAELGVSVFFVISGFLITRLLLAEMAAGGGIRLGRFYRRRALRIFPALYVYLAALGLLWAAGWLPEHRGSFIAAASYTWNYYPHAQGWYLNHIWSLCLEEQFYLLWPLCLALSGRRRGAWLAATAVALCPLSRVATYFLWPSMHAHNDTMLHTRIDTILFGCLLALVWDTDRFQGVLRRHARRSRILTAVALLGVASPWAASRFHGAYMDPLGYSLEAALIAFVVAGAVLRPETWCGRALNSRLLRHLGVISYSLYLWQQLFLGPRWHALPWALLLALGAAEASYFLVERPVLRWRDRGRGLPPPARAPAY
ncbi:MAG TPA: acyltransferase [Terriglobales bacterium]|nr:acyltransferase [Terriglobales bacterium]